MPQNPHRRKRGGFSSPQDGQTSISPVYEAAWSIHSPKAGASAAGTAPTQITRVPGSSGRKLRGTAGSGAATIVPGPAAWVSDPSVNSARPATTM